MQEIPEYTTLGYNIASEAILQQHLEEYNILKQQHLLSIPLFSSRGSSSGEADTDDEEEDSKGEQQQQLNHKAERLHIIFYCEEYGNAWWPK